MYLIYVAIGIIALFFGLEESGALPHRELKTQHQEKFEAYSLTGYGQGTTYTITYFTAGQPITSLQIDSILNEIDASMSLYKSESLINRFNSSKSGVRMDRHFRKVASRALDVYRDSGRMFDITVFPLVQAWNFGRLPSDSLPGDELIRELTKHVGSDKLMLVQDSLLKTDPAVKIDLNGIAQGYSVDVLASFLETRGIHDYMVELGGEIRVKGVKKSSNTFFTIGIQSPRDDGMDPESMETVLEIPEGAITTSGNYHKYYTSRGKKISHLISPLTGYPFQNEMISATVFTKEAMTADAFDNVFMGMGVENSFKFLKSHPEMEIYLIYQKEDGSIADTASTGFKRLFKQIKKK
ncbi:FAD:protein FMN transferase [Arcticibacter sp.]|uniref:FAD:protein FMN transferase n=1 Tax=Arcticibacter sp. TaxID=1872630 RepID=UPI00388EB6F6